MVSICTFQLNMGGIFDQEADLSGLLDTYEQLYVSNIIHKAFIEVNEDGSEAAASSRNFIEFKFFHFQCILSIFL